MRDALNGAYVRLRDEPVLTAALVSAALVLLVTLGLPVPANLDAALTVLILAASAWLARRKVTPQSKL